MFPAKFYAMLAYSMPSMIVYWMTIFMVKRFSKDFSVTFIKLYVAFFVFNTITFCNSFITVRFPQNTCKDCLLSFLFQSHTLTKRSWFPLHIFYTIHFSMGYVQFLMIFLTSFNRFSMIFWSNSYEKTWNKYFPYIIVGVIVFPIPLTWSALTADTYYTYTESLECYTVASTMDRALIYNFLVFFLLAITILTAFTNIASFYQLSCMTYKISVAERNLLFMSGSLFLVQLIADTNTTINRLVINDNNKNMIWSRIATTLLPYVSDGLTFIHPWMLLLFSAKARRRFLKMYIPGFSKIGTLPNSNNFVSQEFSLRRSTTNNSLRF